MGFLTRVAAAVTLPAIHASASLAANAQNRPASAGMVATGVDDNARRDYRNYLEAYADRPWVRACIDRIAVQMKVAPFCAHVEKQGEDVEVDHPLVALMRMPNPRTTGGLFRQQRTVDLKSTGNFYAEIVYRAGKPAELWRMDPSRVSIIVDRSTGDVSGYLYRPETSAKPIAFNANEVWHSRLANPLDDYRGLSPLASVRDSIIFDYAASEQVNAFFRNGMRVSGVLGGPDDATPQETALVQQLMEARHGRANAHRVLVLRGGWDYKDLASSPKDADWVEGKKMSRVEVCAAIGTPPIIAGDFERATYSNYDTAYRSFWQTTVTEEYAALDDDLNAFVLPLFGDNPQGVRVGHDLAQTPAMMEDADARAKRADAGFAAGVLTLNEAREVRGEEPLESGQGDVRRIPPGVTEVNAYDDPPDPSTTPPPEPPPATDPVTDPSGNEPDPPAGARSRRSDGVLRRADSASRLVDEAERLLGTHMRAERDAIVEHMTGTRALDANGRLKSFDWSAWAARLIGVAKVFHLSAIEAAWVAAASLGLGDGWNANHQSVAPRVQWLAARANGIASISGTQKAAVIDAIEAAIVAGDPIGPAIRAAYAPWTGDSAWKANRVARTETGVAFNTASTDVYRANGVGFVEVHDGDGDPECAAANGAIWSLDDAEANPLDHPNCVRDFGPWTGDPPTGG